MDALLNIDLDTILFGNMILDYIKAIVALVIFAIAFKLVQFIILHRLGKLAEKTKTDIDDTFITIVRSLRPPFYYFLAFYFAVKFLALSASAVSVINGVLIVWVVYQIIIAIQILIDYILNKRVFKDSDTGTKAAINYVSRFVKALLWVGGTMLVLSNLGVNITSVIAGLGIGGIAIAFALQNILSDLFSSFAIYFDKPFIVGDFIILGEHKGTVEKIGIKTTRIRSAMGEEIVISNNELTSTRVQNYGRLKERRNVFTIGVTYDTTVEKLKKIPDIIKQAVEASDKTRFDRAHFSSFGDFSLNFDVSYYVQSDDYKKFMDIKQEINLALTENFAKEGIEFAYPTQTIYVTK